jgi:biopolymer transport protein ExbD
MNVKPASFWIILLLLAFTLISLALLETRIQERHDLIYNSSIMIPKDSELYFQRDKIAPGDITPRIKQFLQGRSADQIIHVKPSWQVKLSSIIPAIASIQDAGHQNIAIATIVNKGEMFASTEIGLLVLTEDCPVKEQHQDKGQSMVASAELPFVRIQAHVDIAADPVQQLLINSQPVSVAQLSEKLRQLLSEAGDKKICLESNVDASFGDMAPILEAIRTAGAKRLIMRADCGPLTDSGSRG